MTDADEENQISENGNEENNQKLNINKKNQIESSRDELIKDDNISSKEENNKIKNEENVEEKKEGEEGEKKEGEGEEKKEEQQETLTKKIKFPIIPYKVSDSYPSQLLDILKKQNRIRPKVLLDPEKDDITRSIKDLDAEEEKQKIWKWKKI